MKPPTKPYLEDGFELEEFKATNKQNRRKAFMKRNKKVITGVSCLLGLLSCLIALQLYSFAAYSVQLWRTKQLTQVAQDMNAVPTTLATAMPNVLEASAAPVVRPAFAAMMETFHNTDIVGFVTIEGTNINNPVVQTTNNEFYLNHDVTKESNVAGSIFMDYENNITTFSPNTILYGHNMKNKSMFHNLRLFADRDYFDSHNTVLFETLYEDTTWEVFSFYSTTTDFNYIQADFSSSAAFLKLATQMQERSVHQTDVVLNDTDKILTLSTCTNTADDMRYVLHARLMPKTNTPPTISTTISPTSGDE